MNVKAFRLITIFLLTSVLVPITPVLGHGTVDQQYAPSFAAAGWNNVGFHDPIGQSFTPTLPSVVGVDLGLENVAGVGRTLTASIHSVSITGPVLASTTFVLPPGGPSFVHVDFASPAAVTPSATYFLRLEDPTASAGVHWFLTIPGGTYAGGNSITSGVNQPGGDYFFRTYGTAAAGITTDWAITNVWTDPPAPRAGDPVIFHALVNILSTTGSYPQPVQIYCLIDGIPCGSGTFTFTGPGPADIHTSTPWLATPGGHTLIWTVDPTYAYNDPNRSNNSGTYPFVVGGPPPGGTTTGEFDFAISASPTTASVNAGDQATYTISVSLASGAAASVSLSASGLPSGAIFQFNPPSGQPPFTSSFTITTQAGASAGSYDLSIIGSGGGKTHSINVKLVISAPAEFSLTTTTPAQTGSQGQSVAYIIQVSATGAFTSPITLSSAGLPKDATAAFDPPSGAPPLTSTLRINIGERSTSGSYTVTVTAAGGGKVKGLTLVLNVQERPGGIGDLGNYWQIILAVIILAAAVGFFLQSRKKKSRRRR